MSDYTFELSSLYRKLFRCPKIARTPENGCVDPMVISHAVPCLPNNHFMSFLLIFCQKTIYYEYYFYYYDYYVYDFYDYYCDCDQERI